MCPTKNRAAALRGVTGMALCGVVSDDMGDWQGVAGQA